MQNKERSFFTKFGPHLIFDGYGADPTLLGNMELCFDALNMLAKLAGMRKMMEPIVIKSEGNLTLGGKDPGGFSGFVIIQESHISLHTFVKRKFLTVDLYSCKEFDPESAINYLKEAFDVKEADIVKLDRGLKYPTENLI